MKLRTRSRLKGVRKGFTLLELVLAIVVAGIVCIPLALLIQQHVESAFESRDRTLALNLARLEMETVKNMSYASIATASSTNSGYDITRTVSFVAGDGTSPESLKQITVEVRKTGSADLLVRLMTYLARNVSYGI